MVFVKWHNKKKQQKLCKFVLYGETPVTNIFRHFEVCPCETTGALLGAKLNSKLKPGVRPPTKSSFVDVFSKLSDSIHNSLLRTSAGVVVVPHSLVNEEKRFLVRYLMANGEDVAILGKNGVLRSPKEREINTPPKTQTSQTHKRKREN